MPVKNAMTVDVEDYFHVSAFETHIDRDDWDNIVCRIPQNLDKILALFDKHNTKATFFTLGWVAERYPHLIRDIAASGHEIASHGWSHIRIPESNPDEFYQDVDKTRKLLQDISGQPVYGYRAASYSVTRESFWIYEKLAEAGYRYSSSIFPIKHPYYGMPNAPKQPFWVTRHDITEIPLTTVELLGKPLPLSGGGWFRLIPYFAFKSGLKKVNQINRPGIFYIHPWEFDPNQPRQENISVKTAFRHYMNLSYVEQRMDRLLKDFQWDTMQSVFFENVDCTEMQLTDIAV